MTDRGLTIKSTPRFADMIYLKSRHGNEDVRVLEVVYQRCKSLGHLLDLKDALMFSIWNAPYTNIQEKCETTITEWLEGQGRGPVTWETFIEAIDILNLKELSKRLRQEFEQSPTSGCPPGSSAFQHPISNEADISKIQDLLDQGAPPTEIPPVNVHNLPSCPLVYQEHSLTNVTSSILLHNHVCPSTEQFCRNTEIKHYGSKSTSFRLTSNVAKELQTFHILLPHPLEQCPTRNSTEANPFQPPLTNMTESKWLLSVRLKYHVSVACYNNMISISKVLYSLKMKKPLKLQAYPLSNNDLLQCPYSANSQQQYSVVYYKKMQLYYYNSLQTVYERDRDCTLEHVTQYCKKLHQLLRLRETVMEMTWTESLSWQNQHNQIMWESLEGLELTMLTLQIFITALNDLQIEKLVYKICGEQLYPKQNTLIVYGQPSSLTGEQSHLLLDQNVLEESAQLPSSTDKLLSSKDNSDLATEGEEPCLLDGSSNNQLPTINKQINRHSSLPILTSQELDSLEDQYPTSTFLGSSPSSLQEEKIITKGAHSLKNGKLDTSEHLQVSFNKNPYTDELNTARNDLEMDLWKSLMIALEKGDAEIIELLLKNGAQINKQDKNGMSTLMIASLNGHIDAVKILLENRAEINLKDDDGLSALMYACQSGHIEVTKVLLQSGAHLNTRDNNGKSALIIASQHGHSEVSRILIINGAELDLQDDNGITALMMASQNNHCHVMKLLLDYEAIVDLRDRNGATALMIASGSGHAEAVEILLDNGAQAHLQTEDSWSPLMISSQNGHTEVVKVLLRWLSKNMQR